MSKRSIESKRPLARLLLGAAGPSCIIAAALLQACGSSSNLTCGTGTEKKGSTCVAKQATVVTPPTLDGGTPDGSAGGSGGTGGSGGSGGSNTDAGQPDKLVFGGVTSVSPATPAGGVTPPSSLVVTWQAATYPAFPTATFHYEVFSATTAGGENYSLPVNVTPIGTTSVRIDGLSSTKPTFFVVRAVADVGEAKDANSIELSGTPAIDSTPPTFAGAKTATPLGDSSVLVKWDAATDDLTKAPGIVYDVYWATGSTTAQQLAVVTDPGATSAVVTGLPTANAPYFFRVAAVDAAGNVTPTTGVLISGSTAKDTTPPTFGGCRATAKPTASGGTIVWDPATDDTTPASGITYNVYAFDVPVDHDTQFTKPDGVFLGVTQGQITTLLPAGNYEIVCRAVDASGNEDQNRHTVGLQTVTDSLPPTFVAGTATAVASATTVTIDWPQAHDLQTADTGIQYVIYGGTSPGGEDVTTPIYSQTGGTEALLMATDLLKAFGTSDGGAQSVSNTDFYFEIAARDQAENQTPFLPELHVTTLISFENDVQPIFTAHCALSGCHVPGNPPEGQILEDGYAYASIVNVTAGESALISPADPVTIAGIKRIDATSSDPTHSYLWRKINGGTMGTIYGSHMPPDYTTGPHLTDPRNFATIKGWIVQGAQDN